MDRTMNLVDEKMGCRARDKVTGFEGIITAKISFLFGCFQYAITPKAKDDKIPDANWFDEGRIEIIDQGIRPQDVAAERPGGMNGSGVYPKEMH